MYSLFPPLALATSPRVGRIRGGEFAWEFATVVCGLRTAARANFPVAELRRVGRIRGGEFAWDEISEPPQPDPRVGRCPIADRGVAPPSAKRVGESGCGFSADAERKRTGG